MNSQCSAIKNLVSFTALPEHRGKPKSEIHVHSKIPHSILVDGGLRLGTSVLLSMDFVSPEVVLILENRMKSKEVLNKLKLQRFSHCQSELVNRGRILQL